jgi:hypothetical protein
MHRVYKEPRALRALSLLSLLSGESCACYIVTLPPVPVTQNIADMKRYRVKDTWKRRGPWFFV